MPPLKKKSRYPPPPPRVRRGFAFGVKRVSFKPFTYGEKNTLRKYPKIRYRAISNLRQAVRTRGLISRTGFKPAKYRYSR